ncbi:GMP synthase [Candidatus Wirthbacteria bacterium CG2_30_54_11]|uniref:GMP synthase n=1 Tax=Candidatus Wirthbacteria bacterium CG2_30_54_11 TaxID=1817892 RepID=A0A1J5IDM3_9BACT|nr:MAG: GMP synthase [Candidatus Wirthbacteria bacterium CG2_30_54_11]
MHVHIIQHESFESPAAISAWVRDRGHQLTCTRLYMGDRFPSDPTTIDLLVVMGGPQSPATTEAECPHFHAAEEIVFIRQVIDTDIFVLGVCLGAQLIGEALGAKFDHSPNREIGVFDLTLTEAGRQDPCFSKFPEVFQVGHWHGDMPGLTPKAEVLAASKGCPRQIVRYTPRVYGFQCHFEFTLDAINGMIQNCGHELEAYRDLPYIQQTAVLQSHDYQPINQKMFQFLDLWTKE